MAQEEMHVIHHSGVFLKLWNARKAEMRGTMLFRFTISKGVREKKNFSFIVWIE